MRTGIREAARKRVQRKAHHGDVVRTTWKKGVKSSSVILEGPFLADESVECDCSHWDEIIECMGENNAF